MTAFFSFKNITWRGLLLALAALWVLTPLTWQYAPDGTPLGMHPLLSVLHLLLAVWAGFAIAWHENDFINSLQNGALAGALITLLDFACQLVFTALMLAANPVARNAAGTALGALLADAAVSGLAAILFGSGLGSIGGLLSWLVRQGYNKVVKP